MTDLSGTATSARSGFCPQMRAMVRITLIAMTAVMDLSQMTPHKQFAFGAPKMIQYTNRSYKWRPLLRTGKR